MQKTMVSEKNAEIERSDAIDESLFSNEVEIRPMTPDDFPFVHDLCRQQNSFSTPTEYIIWMQSIIHDDANFIALLNREPVGYMLGQIVKNDTFWIWQVAINSQGDARVIKSLFSKIFEASEKYHLRRLAFSATPKKATAWGRILQRGYSLELSKISAAVGGEFYYETIIDAHFYDRHKRNSRC